MGKKVKLLRNEGLVPAVVYGKHVEAASISCVKNDLLKVYRASGYTTPVELTGDMDQLVLIHSLQLDPISDEIISADFLAVSKTEKVKANIPVVMTGECPLEKLNEGRVQLVKDTITVEAFPQDLPSQIEIDLSGLDSIDSVVFVSDVKVDDKVVIVDEATLPVVTVLSLSEDTASDEGTDTASTDSTEESK
ncbi:50S ribosomal protein L25 [bacterium]|nr:50S ribosomal protein L25 [bacterium]